MIPRAPVYVAFATGAALCAASGTAIAQAGPVIPLCAGVTVVTAASQPSGDYESIKTIESANGDGLRIKYSTERTVADMLTGPTLTRFTTHRHVGCRSCRAEGRTRNRAGHLRRRVC